MKSTFRCVYCNSQLVRYVENSELLEKAIKYINQGTGLFIPDKKNNE